MNTFKLASSEWKLPPCGVRWRLWGYLHGLAVADRVGRRIQHALNPPLFPVVREGLQQLGTGEPVPDNQLRVLLRRVQHNLEVLVLGVLLVLGLLPGGDGRPLPGGQTDRLTI